MGQAADFLQIFEVIAGLGPTVAAVPVVSGTLIQGQTLTASAPTFNGSQPITIGYQWVRCDANGVNCVAIAGSTAPGETPWRRYQSRVCSSLR